MKALIKIAKLFSNAMHNLSNFHEVNYDLWVYLFKNMQIVLGDLYLCIRRIFSEFNGKKHTTT